MALVSEFSVAFAAGFVAFVAGISVSACALLASGITRLAFVFIGCHSECVESVEAMGNTLFIIEVVCIPTSETVICIWTVASLAHWVAVSTRISSCGASDNSIETGRARLLADAHIWHGLHIVSI